MKTRRQVTDDLEEVRRPMLTDLCLATFTITWIWWLFVFPERNYPPQLPLLAPPLLPSLVVGLVLTASRLPLWSRSVLFLLGLETTFALAYFWTHSLSWLCYQVVSIVVAGVLIGRRAAFGTALGAVILSVICARQLLGHYNFEELLPIAGLLLGTAATSWISSRGLYTALDWLIQSQAKAWQAKSEAERRREELRRALDSLQHAHATLDRTSRDLQAATFEAEEARKVKSRFVANISHEFRTPLNIITGFAEMIITSHTAYSDVPLPRELVGDLITVWRQAEHLLGMIDDVLDLAQIETDRFTLAPEPTDPLVLLRDALEDGRSLIEARGLQLKLSLPSHLPKLVIDETRIRQVILNLLNNAARFTSDGYVEVGAFKTDRDAVIYVRDSGRGIPSDRLGAIFEEFEQADTSMHRDEQGVGLGLAISRQLVRLHGGRIWVESEVGKGSTFYVALPLADRQTAVQPFHARRPWPRPATTAGEPRPAVAVVPDALMGRSLQRHSEELVMLTTDSASAAANAVREHRPGVAVVVGDDPGDLGPLVETGQALLSSVAPFDLPVIVCGLATEWRARDALRVAGLLIKPVSKQQVLEAIREHVQTPGSVVIVDDEADMLRLLARMVREEWPNAELRTATCVEEAAGLLDTRPDVVLLDLLLPGADGTVLLRAMRREPELATVPVIVITARGPAEDLAAIRFGEIRILQNSSFTSGDIARLARAVTEVFPPHYGLGPRDGRDNAASPPGGQV